MESTQSPNEDNGDGFNEIYIATNPPLLPSGVDHVIRSTWLRFTEGQLIEMLYEPDVPWFKCIVTDTARDEVKNCIDGLLREIYEEDVCALDPDEAEELQDEHGNAVDVEIISETPRIVPWRTFQSDLPRLRESYEPYQYPEVLSSAPYKSIWRRLESYPGATIDDLLQSASHVTAGFGESVTIEDFEKLVQCKVYQNLDQSVLYIGSCESEDSVKDAVKRLDNIFEIVMTLDPREKTRHVIPIIIENHRDYKLAYRWLSHIGLAKRTYLSPGHSHSTDDEYAALMGSATLRTATFNEYKGEWVVDQRVYPLTRGAATFSEPANSSEVFEEQAYTRKKTIAKDQPLDSLVSKTLPIRPLPSIQSHTKERVSKMRSKKKADQSGDASNSSSLSTSQAHFPHQTTRQATGMASPAENSQSTHVTTAPGMVGQWVEEQQKEHHQREHDTQTFDKANEPSQTQAEKSSDDKKNLELASQGQTENREPPESSEPLDFDLLGIELTKTQVKGSTSSFNIIDSDVPFVSDYPPMDPEAVVRFPVREDDDLIELHTTMQQKAGRRKLKNNSQGNRGSVFPDSPRKRQTEKTVETQPTKDNTALGSSPKSQAGGVEASNQKSTLAGKALDSKPATSASTNLQPKVSEASNSMAIIRGRSDKLKFRKSHADLLEHQLKAVGNILHKTSGKVGLELALGRIYFKDLSESTVDAGRGPHWNIKSLLASLEDGMPHNSIGFQNVLTSSARDAKRIVQLGDNDGLKWKLHDRLAKYEFNCNMYEGEGRESFKVEVDIHTFAYRCFGETEEIAESYVHCPQFAWDMKARATRVHQVLPEKCNLFAKSMVESLSINPAKSGDVFILVPGDESLGITIDRVCIRHHARYRCEQTDGRQLNISMVRPLSKNAGFTGQKLPCLFRGRTWFGANRLNKGGSSGLDEWYEVSLSSSKADSLFQGNMDLGFGKNAVWEMSELDGICADICKPALDMLSQMDDIGSANDNSKGPEMSANSRAGNGQGKFW